jgi:hypothetical protein
LILCSLFAKTNRPLHGIFLAVSEAFHWDTAVLPQLGQEGESHMCMLSELIHTLDAWKLVARWTAVSLYKLGLPFKVSYLLVEFPRCDEERCIFVSQSTSHDILEGDRRYVPTHVTVLNDIRVANTTWCNQGLYVILIGLYHFNYCFWALIFMPMQGGLLLTSFQKFFCCLMAFYVSFKHGTYRVPEQCSLGAVFVN